MYYAVASEPRPGGNNEDFAAVTADAAVVLDGAGIPPELPTGCVHGVTWFVRQLGATLLTTVLNQHGDLCDCLDHALRHVAALHADTCDLHNPFQPSSTVALARLTANQLEWLVLADSAIVIDTTRHLEVHTDDRIHRVARAERADLRTRAGHSSSTATDVVRAEREARNTEHGYWVATAQPEAAQHALTGSTPLADVSRFALLTDGATRIVDRFGILDWNACLDVMDTAGPAALLSEVRRHENEDPDRTRWPRSKQHDDATAVYCYIAAR